MCANVRMLWVRVNIRGFFFAFLFLLFLGEVVVMVWVWVLIFPLLFSSMRGERWDLVFETTGADMEKVLQNKFNNELR